MEEKILSDTKFTEEIRRLVETNHISYMDAVIIFAQRHNIDLEHIDVFMTQSIKSELRKEAVNLHYLKREKARISFE
jgi:uncharacterized protein YeaC (DUF1315 family)